MKRTRREALGLLGGASLATLSGCSMLGGSSSDDEDDEDDETPTPPDLDGMIRSPEDSTRPAETTTSADESTPADENTPADEDAPADENESTGGNTGTGDVVFESSFESSLGDAILDWSQEAGEVQRQEDVVASGTHSLRMRSSNGGNTKARVRTADTFSGPRRYAVDVYKITDESPKGRLDMKLVRDTGTYFQLVESGLCGTDGGGCVAKKESGNKVLNERFAEAVPTGEWTTFAIEVRADDTVEFQIGDEMTIHEPDDSWLDAEVEVTLMANVWASGDGTLDVRYDNLRVERL